MPILGIYASAISGNLASPSYESIATVTVGSGGSSSISFTSIPSTYQHLQIRYLARSNSIYQFEFANMQFNSDSSSSYVTHMLSGTGAAAQSEAFGASSSFYGAGLCAGNPNTSGVFAAGVIDLLDYANTNKNKTIRTLSGLNNNNDSVSGRQIALSSGVFIKTDAISSIVLTGNGANFVQYSSFALYGIKG